MYGYICKECGAHLDPGEKCDCREEKQKYIRLCEELFMANEEGQLVLRAAV